MIRFNKFTAVLFLMATMLFLSGCVKNDFDEPPVKTLPVGTVYTISQLRQMYADSGAMLINYDASVYATVTMDESTGNIYKSAYVQDGEAAINIHKTASGGLRVGDSIRIYLKNTVLSEYYTGILQIDNVNPDSNIVILGNQKYLQPQLVTISELLNGDLESKLIKLEGVQFSTADLGLTYADANSSANRNLEDCNGNMVAVRTSNYATFAGVVLPEGNGDLIAIVGKFEGKPQLYIRTLSEVNLNGERCGGGGGGGEITPVDEVDEQFDGAVDYENISIYGWTNKIVAGNRAWTGKSFNDNKYAQATGYNSELDDMETWLITPPVYNTTGDKKLTFKSSMAYWTHTGDNKPMTIWASTDYDGTNFETANWTDITSMATLPDAGSGNYNWVESGEISLADFTGNVAIAFKYKGSGTETTSFQIDDVKISTEGGGGGGGEITPVTKVDEKFDGAVDYENISFEGWTDQIVAGTRAWTGKTYDNNKYAQATGYNSGLDDMETWLITPPVINTAGDLKLSFKSAMAYWSHQAGNNPLTVLVSTDYNGTNFETATWTDISDLVTIPNENSGDNTWVETTGFSLADYTGNVCVAFKYKGSDSESTSIRIDDVLISGDGGGGGGGDALPSLNEPFGEYTDYDPIDQNGWVDIMVAGDRAWIAKTYDGNQYAQATGYNSGLSDMETWMVTPLVDNTNGDKTLTFKASMAYWKHNSDQPLKVFVSTDYDGSNVASATWTLLSPTLPTSSNSNYEWVSSGNVDLSAYVGNVAIAFKYKGSDSESTSIQIDDVVIE